ncbi:MAG: PEP/pyruvate-binding domain-containing protein [Eubacteriales bacterium]|nr:PEP/pyruvate-binding domain-containing protein [Eubacteriales bacterium]
MKYHEKVSTGMPGFDETIDLLRMGDNVVWQIDDISDYAKVVEPYVKKAREDRRKIVYLRFGSHQPVVEHTEDIQLYYVDAAQGFEQFATTVHHIAQKEGRKVFYVFDCLTELLKFWYSDLMIGNFFKVTCPFLYYMDTVAYFAIRRNHHTFDTIARIRETTQCLFGLYIIQESMYIHPLKADGRYSPTMFFPHRIEGDKSVSITSSTEAAELFSGFEWDKKRLDYWNVTMDHAKEYLKKSKEEQEEMKNLLISLFIGREKRIRELCTKHFELEDLLKIVSREVGTGYIGGKSIGMLLARKIVKNAKGERKEIQEYLEPDDSFFIGADVYYTYIVQNGWWEQRLEQKTQEGYFSAAESFRAHLLSGSFPEIIEEEFVRMLEYFGQSPVIVRSSSLQEDNFGNAFAGKYESVFCVNQGTPEERLQAFEDAVRRVYASTMNPDALHYRRQRGLELKDEQMAILVQRVSGDYYGNYFFPHAAGVGNSSNLYVWDKHMDMEAGMLRLVFGLGTRAVDRVIGDYVKIVALDAPSRLPLLTAQDERKFSQHKADVLDLQNNIWCSKEVSELMKEDIKVSSSLFMTMDYAEADRLRELGYTDLPVPSTLNFKRMLTQTEFPRIMKNLLKLLSEEYDYPVDIEFTVNFKNEKQFFFNLVQCRPLQTRGLGKTVEIPKLDTMDECLFYSEGNFMGGNLRVAIDKIIFVDVHEYLSCSEQDKYQVARNIGMLNTVLKNEKVLLMGPGRWGTTTPSLGVPVHFTEISNMTAMCEISYQSEGLMPELSYGSHFFQDLVESGVFYIALFKEQEGVIFHEERLDGENLLDILIPEAAEYSKIIKVFDGKNAELYSDIRSQRVFCR